MTIQSPRHHVQPQQYKKPNKILGSEQALALVQLPDTFAEGAWDKLLKTEGTFDFPSHTTITFSFHKIFIGFSLYIKEYKPFFYELKYEVELNLFSQHVVSQLQHSCGYLKYLLFF